jgi:intraflagellar transport protein 140
LVSLEWDLVDARVIACQCAKSKLAQEGSKILTFFVGKSGIIHKDSLPVAADVGKLVATAIPQLVYVKLDQIVTDKMTYFHSTLIREYQGVSHDPQTLKMITTFCFNLATGNVEEAIKGIKIIKNDSVWESMARMCIKKRKIKLAKICIGKLKNAKALRTISSMSGGANDDVAAIHIYIQLGMYDDARELMEATENYGLLENFYQGMDKWEQALEVAASKDRMSLPLTFYNFARHLSDSGDRSGAIAGILN